MINLLNSLVESTVQFIGISLNPEKKLRTKFDTNKSEPCEDVRKEVYENRGLYGTTKQLNKTVKAGYQACESDVLVL